MRASSWVGNSLLSSHSVGMPQNWLVGLTKAPMKLATSGQGWPSKPTQPLVINWAPWWPPVVEWVRGGNSFKNGFWHKSIQALSLFWRTAAASTAALISWRIVSFYLSSFLRSTLIRGSFGWCLMLKSFFFRIKITSSNMFPFSSCEIIRFTNIFYFVIFLVCDSVDPRFVFGGRSCRPSSPYHDTKYCKWCK